MLNLDFIFFHTVDILYYSCEAKTRKLKIVPVELRKSLKTKK